MDKPMQTLASTVLLISPDAGLCSAVRSALQQSEPACHIATVANFAAARHTVAELSPDVIVLQESSLRPLQDASHPWLAPLSDMVATLAGFAPVVVLGDEETPPALASLIAAGAADFVESGEAHLPVATACVEKRLHSARRFGPDPGSTGKAITTTEMLRDENFGELLRHELNNPLTGILGNAELLLAELRRVNGERVSPSDLKRLEIIAALAVRMRETVRRLSQACDSREAGGHSL
jgi:signal transduction histidine kinase